MLNPSPRQAPRQVETMIEVRIPVRPARKVVRKTGSTFQATTTPLAPDPKLSSQAKLRPALSCYEEVQGPPALEEGSSVRGLADA